MTILILELGKQKPLIYENDKIRMYSFDKIKMYK